MQPQKEATANFFRSGLSKVATAVAGKLELIATPAAAAAAAVLPKQYEKGAFSSQEMIYRLVNSLARHETCNNVAACKEKNAVLAKFF